MVFTKKRDQVINMVFTEKRDQVMYVVVVRGEKKLTSRLVGSV